MPPDGYTSVTLPNDLVQELEAIGDTQSAARGVRLLLVDAVGVDDDLHDQLDRIEEAQGGTVARSLELVENDMEAVLEKLDRIEDAATTAEARTGSIENTLDNMGAGR